MPDDINRGGQIMTPKNVDEVEIMGADAEFNYRPLHNLHFFLSYNYNETRDAKKIRCSSVLSHGWSDVLLHGELQGIQQSAQYNHQQESLPLP
ncbi:MAG: hypothetical protein D3907_14570, partial [Candidatus Electrothrix sp. AUS3]|nr:hypothetical protein [Candidatus Electrothrix gigas]